ncbi:hypothetical protein HMPREF9943_00945 [Eggerthia catenaformis OT 569 = DSM 20559]|uniref:Uncharacterized protein n=1 Tax=Eggerthia catenaformis OT 569 = DSM 20559 TaxID=999415 RepID=M2NFB8_9FIRM|nr:hypothetical protein [Eggerthia catenaformis]EMD16903.1 hypothetical protein HMPREF9943_00945 [Eggerthia catenaformis OT 569 = DSM 20559]OUC51562.1 hypothetical protein B7939_05075 [Eggerthia catenaformis]
MQELKEHKYMDLLTTIAYIISIVLIVIGAITNNWALYLLIVVFVIILFRLTGYIIDRIHERK